ncbi:MAG: DUF6058 family natural product biosynthesis protein [Gammaproteobacteria bacterium]|nr:DUF6058 family natural product biosynthesis protein [Gammaproteobacteria bacterium]
MSGYIKNHYLTVEQLAACTNISLEQLKAFIDNSCIPKHSHTITIKSIFHTDIFGDSEIEENVFYYHPSLIQFAIKANKYYLDGNFVEVASKMKNDFFNELCQAISEIEIAHSVFQNCFDMNRNVLITEIEKIMVEHWPYILDGTYGVCLKEISAKNVLLKNIAVSILEEWVNANDQNKKMLHDKASYAASLYDKVASEFAPHEFHKSTRDRLFNKFKSNIELQK